jgi:hypothetical protein
MKQFLIPFLVMAIGCGCESQPKKMNADKHATCVATCDSSLEHCIKVMGDDHRVDCHTTYNTVCMPACTQTE